MKAKVVQEGQLNLIHLQSTNIIQTPGMVPRQEDTKMNVLVRFHQLQGTHPSDIKYWGLTENK